MSWAGRRKALISTILGLIVVAALAVLAFSIFYKTPTCTDNKKNQDEVGVDCGGSCSTLCSSQVQDVTVSWTRAVYPSLGRVDAIAYVSNPNSSAYAKAAPFTLELYGADGSLIAHRDITIDLPARSLVPVYIPQIASTDQTVARAFLTPDLPHIVWTHTSSPLPDDTQVSNISWTLGDAPRVTATLTNQTALPLTNRKFVATVFGSDGTAIAASQTLIPLVRSQGSVPLVFTWNTPFPEEPVKVEILPRPNLTGAL